MQKVCGFRYGTSFYLIQKDDHEPDSHFYYRAKKIMEAEPADEKEFEQADTKARMKVNEKFLKCKYEEDNEVIEID